MSFCIRFLFELICFLLCACSVYGLYVNDSCQTNEGVAGICKAEIDCLGALKLRKTKGIWPTLCGFQVSTVILCCTEEHNVYKNDGVESRSENIKGSISNEMCDAFSQADYITCTWKVKQIVGGRNAGLGHYPHMAAIGYEKSSKELQFNCGGSLISEYFVLTAAHCSFSRDLGAPTTVRLGVVVLNGTSEQVPEDFAISNITLHPDYKYPAKYHDIALIRLNRSVIFNAHIRPACLWQTEELPNLQAEATGWGQTIYGLGGHRPTVLQIVKLDIINQTTCISLPSFAAGTGRRATLPRGFIPQQMCAGDLKRGGKDTCQGDSGGPLQRFDDNNICMIRLIGITSYGLGCGEANSPGVYTRVSSYLDWIEGIVWPVQNQTTANSS